MSLDRIRLKVWDGEALSASELEELRDAVQSRPAPGLPATLVQALVNADAVEEALQLVTRLLKDAPHDAQLHIAHARALITVERWNEAEAPLKKALERNPGDPEVLKAFALVHMRRGEFGRARETVEQLLRDDPLDDEAQQLSLELENTEGATLESSTGVSSVSELRRSLTQALQKRSVPFLVQGEHLLIRSGRNTVARLGLREVLADFRNSGGELDSFASSMAAELSERSLGVRAGRLHLLSKVLPVLRDDAFLERAEGAVRREGPTGLWIFYVLDDPSFVRYVPQRALERNRVSLEDLDRAAWKNLGAKPAPVKPIELATGALRIASAPTGLWALTGNDGHDAARLLLEATRAELTGVLGSAPVRVYLGLRELVLLASLEHRDVVAQLESMGATEDGIGGIFELRQGVLKSVSAWKLEDITA